MSPIDETAVRKDLEKTARKILSRKTWAVVDAAKLLGYSKNNMYIKLGKRRCMIVGVGGRQHVYAIDVFEIFQEQGGFEFPEIESQWRKTHGITKVRCF